MYVHQGSGASSSSLLDVGVGSIGTLGFTSRSSSLVGWSWHLVRMELQNESTSNLDLDAFVCSWSVPSTHVFKNLVQYDLNVHENFSAIMGDRAE